MTGTQAAALAVMAAFYAAYYAKMLLQRRKGVQTDRIGKGGKPKKVLRTELLMKAATFAIVPVELVSIALGRQVRGAAGIAGVAIAAAGVLAFILAMASMRDSWRAGIPEAGETELVTSGIYRFSRNPAFLGFDLMYAGLLTAYFNPVHLAFALWAMAMLHLQILQEEQFLAAAFGASYAEYKGQTGRYFSVRQRSP